MGQARPSTRHHERNANVPPLRRDIELIDVHALQEENTQLRALVIQLSKLVIKNLLTTNKATPLLAALFILSAIGVTADVNPLNTVVAVVMTNGVRPLRVGNLFLGRRNT